MDVNSAYSAVQASSAYGQDSKQKGAITLGEGLGKNSFLQLLITQMRYQDPLEPVKDTEYIAQLAQFNSLEQMQNLNDKFDSMLRWSQMTQASSLIGKKIDGIVPQGVDSNGDGQPDISRVSGVVNEVRYVAGEPLIVVGNTELRLGDVLRIYQ